MSVEYFTQSYTCHKCGFKTNDRRVMVFTHPLMPPQCYSIGACKRRQRRNAVIAEMEEMAKKPYVHPVDKFNFAAISICAGILAGTIIVCLLFLFGF